MRAYLLRITQIALVIPVIVVVSGCGNRSMRPIADSEKTVTEGEALGYRFWAEAHKTYTNKSVGGGSPSIRWVECKIYGDRLDRSKKETDPMELSFGLTRSDKEVSKYPEVNTSIGMHADEQVKAAFSQTFETSTPFNRCEIILVPRRFRTYSEPIVLKNITITPFKQEYYQEGDRKPHYEMGYRTSFEGPQKFVTTSGLTLTFTQVNVPSNFVGYDLIFEVKVQPGLENLRLDKSPLCQETKKPVSILFKYPENVSEPEVATSRDQKTDSNCEYIYVRNAGTFPKKPLLIPELKLLVVQKAILDEKTLKLILPVKPEQARAITVQ